MEFFLDHRPLWAVLISVIAAGLIMLSGRHPNLRETWTILAAVGKVVIVFSMLPAVLSGQVIETAPLEIVKGIELHLRADSMGMLFAALASFLWILTSFYNIGYMRGDKAKHQTGYFASFALSLSAAMGIAFAANLITFFIFLEILTVVTYPLVIHKRNKDAIYAGRKYLAYLLICGQLLLIAAVWVEIIAPGASFQPGGFLAETGASVLTLQILFVLMVIGTAVKAGIMPIHDWLPEAMIAPTPVSALLHAVAVVKAGGFGVLRVTGYVFGPELLNEIGMAIILAWVAAFTIVVSSIIALKQYNLKRRLAFSTIGQLSYVVLGAALITPLGFVGGMFHIVAHAFMKITLFFCAGAIYITTHQEDIREMKGLGKQMPLTLAAFTLASLGTAGLPLIAGFVSKFNLALGALQGEHGLFVAVLIASALLSTAYLIPVGYLAFFYVSEKFPRFGEARLDMLLPILICAVFSVILGVAPNFGANFFELAMMASRQIVEGSMSLMGGGW